MSVFRGAAGGGGQLRDAAGNPINIGPLHPIKEVNVPALDTTDAGNDLATIINTAANGGAANLLQQAIAGTVAGHEGKKLSVILMTVETQSVRVSLTGLDPAVYGQVFAKDTPRPHPIDVDDFTKVRIIGNGGAAKVTFALCA